ncbi:unnamed protein product [Prorocentrum cordatum]|uniref:Uncharacterized protein n=1 Tax=Prorocentrum cordatum TaxID=2364126 RepID=A0ABN9W499_9DINO|nr:unnamed protein product [Polarella glacialis]
MPVHLVVILLLAGFDATDRAQKRPEANGPRDLRDLTADGAPPTQADKQESSRGGSSREAVPYAEHSTRGAGGRMLQHAEETWARGERKHIGGPAPGLPTLPCRAGGPGVNDAGADDAAMSAGQSEECSSLRVLESTVASGVEGAACLRRLHLSMVPRVSEDCVAQMRERFPRCAFFQHSRAPARPGHPGEPFAKRPPPPKGGRGAARPGSSGSRAARGAPGARAAHGGGRGV